MTKYITQKELAESLKVPEGTVRQWVFRKKVKTKKKYGKVLVLDIKKPPTNKDNR